MKAVIYTRVSTDEQNPQSQLQDVVKYASERGYEVVRIFEENISGSVDPFERPVFREMLGYIASNRVDVIVMYDLTRFYRARSPSDALSRLRSIMEKYNVLIDFAREPEIEDPLFRELWMFIKSWFATYERIQASLRTRYGIMRLKREGRLYHKPSILHYYAAWLYGKNVGEVTRDELEAAKRQLAAIVLRYWNDPAVKKTSLPELLMRNELREMYLRFPSAPKSYLSYYRLVKRLSEEKVLSGSASQ